MHDLAYAAKRILDRVDALLSDAGARESRRMPGNAFFLDGTDILALPRDLGDSRYPYGQDGFNFWAYGSGYMHCNEGLFSLFLRSAEGQEPRIAFFAGWPNGDGLCRPVSLLPVPYQDGIGEAAVRRCAVFTMSAVYYVARVGAVAFVTRVHVNRRKEICFSLFMQNESREKESFFVSSFLNPYLRHQIYESGEDRWFKEIRLLPPSSAEGDLGSFLVMVNEDEDRYHSLTNYGVIRRWFTPVRGGTLRGHEETASRNQFVGGTRSSLHTPGGLVRGNFDDARKVAAFTENAIAGDIVRVDLEPGGSARQDMVFSCAASGDAAGELAALPLDPEELDRELGELVAVDASRREGLCATVGDSRDARFKPGVFNAFFEHLKKQVEFCSLIKGYIQLSENSLIGIRDVFQAVEGFLFWRPQDARAKMLEALGYTAPDGRCFRQYSLPAANGEPGRMDLRPFIDQGAWVISCVATYLRVTGDWGFLDETCGYHEIVDEASRKVAVSPERNSVLEHLFRIMDFLLRNRDSETRCVLALYGDWNDALDGLGISRDPGREVGTGVSVMATIQVYQNANELADLLAHLDPKKHAGRIEGYRDAARELADGLNRFAVVRNEAGERRIVHGWGDRRSYFVGSFHDPDGVARDGLTSNAFWVLSGLYEKDRGFREPILAALGRLDSKYGFKTFEPSFPPDTPGVGRIGKLPPGTAENGATYVHATVFAIMALFRMGCAREAWEQMVKVLPFTDIHQRLSHSPFVMPNAYGLNPEKNIDGENMNDWQTGSSNVLLKLLIRYVFGLEPCNEGLWIQPASWCPFKSFDLRVALRGTLLGLQFEDAGIGRREFAVNGVKSVGVRDAAMDVDKLWIPYESLGPGEVSIVVRQ